MRVALVITVRNERALLRSNLRYHRFLGIEQAFVFLDHTTDDTAATIRDLGFVHLRPSIDPARANNWPGARVYVDHAHFHSARQCLNLMSVLREARAHGLDWVVHLDADELLCLDRHHAEPGCLPAELASVDPSVESVRFVPLEVCPTAPFEGCPFRSQREFVLTRGHRARRTLWDPVRQSKFKAPLALGHRKGKRAVRVEADLVPRGPHEFLRRDRQRPHEVERGDLLHFYLTSPEHFIRKFRNLSDRPDTLLGGKPIARHKRLWRDMVNGGIFSERELVDYFQTWIMLPDRTRNAFRTPRSRLGRRPLDPILTDVSSVQSCLSAMHDGQGSSRRAS